MSQCNGKEPIHTIFHEMNQYCNNNKLWMNVNQTCNLWIASPLCIRLGQEKV